MANLLPPMPVGMAPDSSFWNDWYEKLRTLVNELSTSISWNIITGKPTTLAGYGITDAQTKLNNSAGLAAAISDETGTGVVVFNNAPVFSDNLLHRSSVAMLNGAGVATGTLTNAPAAGNPTKWIAINDNGTTRYIPTW